MTTTKDPIHIVLVTTATERAAVIKSWGEARRMFEGMHHSLFPTTRHGPTFQGLPLTPKPNFHVYLACAAMGIPGYEAVTVE